MRKGSKYYEDDFDDGYDDDYDDWDDEEEEAPPARPPPSKVQCRRITFCGAVRLDALERFALCESCVGIQ